jgi:branched-chain amino acid transport system ATP-binding protein
MNLLQLENLTKCFGAYKAVDDVSLEIDAGEFISLVGSNGAGKTTLVNIVSAFLAPDGGVIRFKGEDVTATTVNQRIRAGIARSFQLVNLFDRMSVLENVSLSIFSRDGNTRRIGSFADSDTANREEAYSVLEQFGLEALAGAPAAGLAHGERKLLDVAVAFALRPELLFLDEPTSGVSTSDKEKIMSTVSDTVRNSRIAAVVVEHDMDVVFKYSDRIVAMHEGRIFADGTPEEIRANSEVAAVVTGAAMPEAV